MKKITRAHDGKVFTMLTVLATLSVIAFFIWGCSATKKVAKQDSDLTQLKAQINAEDATTKAKIIGDYLKDNPCIFPEVNLDSLCQGYGYQYSPMLDEDYIGKDTVYIKSKAPAPQRILIPVVDKRLSQNLQDSVDALKLRLAECNAKAAGKKEAVAEIKVSKWQPNNWMWVALALAGLSILQLVLKFKK